MLKVQRDRRRSIERTVSFLMPTLFAYLCQIHLVINNKTNQFHGSIMRQLIQVDRIDTVLCKRSVSERDLIGFFVPTG